MYYIIYYNNIHYIVIIMYYIIYYNNINFIGIIIYIILKYYKHCIAIIMYY